MKFLRYGPQDDLDVSRRRGFAIDNQEFDNAVKCAAAVVFDAQDEALCAISVSGIIERLSEARLGQLGERIRETAQDITQVLGGKPAAPGSDH